MQARGTTHKAQCVILSRMLNAILTNCGDCENASWTTPQNRTRIHAPADTVAIVVDVRNNIGATRIHETQGNECVDGVGTEEARTLVIVSGMVTGATVLLDLFG